MKIERRDQEKDRKNSRDEPENANRSQIRQAESEEMTRKRKEIRERLRR